MKAFSNPLALVTTVVGLAGRITKKDIQYRLPTIELTRIISVVKYQKKIKMPGLTNYLL